MIGDRILAALQHAEKTGRVRSARDLGAKALAFGMLASGAVAVAAAMLDGSWTVDYGKADWDHRARVA